jgi:hypothetical protein
MRTVPLKWYTPKNLDEYNPCNINSIFNTVVYDDIITTLSEYLIIRLLETYPECLEYANSDIKVKLLELMTNNMLLPILVNHLNNRFF